jgi:hypothetical protein
MIAKVLVAVVVVALAGGAVAAHPGHGIMMSKDGRVTTIAHGTGVYVMPPPHRDGTTVIFSNIGTKYPLGLYFCCSGATVSGPESEIGFQSWPAMQFVPSTDATITEIDAAVSWVAGTNEINLDLYDDAGGLPGTLLKSFKVTGLQSVGGCCSLAIGRDRTGIAVTGGTPYWVAITTDSKSSNMFGSWEFNSTDQLDALPSAVNKGSGWVTNGGAVPAASFAVYGK